MDTGQWIEHLCSRGHRGSTTPEEAWAAHEVASRFTSLDLRTELRRFRGHRTYGGKLAVHLVPAVIMASLIPFRPDLVLPASLVLGFLILSFLAETCALIDVASRVIPRGDSVNVFAREGKGRAEVTVLITAHLDSQKEGRLFDPRLVEIMKRGFSTTSRITPVHLTFLTVCGLLVTTVLYSQEPGGGPARLLAIIHGTLILWGIISTAIILEWMTGSRYVPGANDNATGVAVMLGLARDLRGGGAGLDPDGLERIEFAFLATGCEETGMGGSLDFIRGNEGFLRKRPVFVLCLDGFGAGHIRYFTRDGLMMTRAYDPLLVSVAREVSRRRFGEERAFVCRLFTDGLAFSTSGYPTITFGSLEGDMTISHYHWRTDTPENVDRESVDEAEGFLTEYLGTLGGRILRDGRRGKTGPACGSKGRI